jgi:trigger factor
MNITRENIDALNAIVKVSIEKNDYEATVNEVLKDYRKKANMPGFRPGKVPAGLVKKMYGKAILADEVNKLLSKNLMQHIVEEKLNILGEPLPNEEKQPKIDWDNDTDFDFYFDIAVAPEIDVKLDKDVKYPYYTIAVDDETVNKQIEAYLFRLGENKEVDAFEEKDTLRGDFVQLDAEGNELKDGIKAENVAIAVDLMKDEELKKQFLGKKAGDVVVFDPVKAYDNRHEVGHMLNVSHEEAEKIEGNFKFTIAKVLRFQPAELTEENIQKIYGEDAGISTEEELKARVKKDLSESFVYSSNYKFAIDTRDAMVENLKFDLPVEFLKRWVKVTNEKLTDEQIEQDFDNFLKDLRWQLIKDQIIRNKGLKITDEDVKALAKETARMQFRQYGLNDVADEHLENYANHMLQNEEEKRRLTTKKQEDMVLEAIKESVTLETKEVSQEEFNKMLEN